jgi:hypothetical protein
MPLEYRRLRKAALGTALVFTASGAILGIWSAAKPGAGAAGAPLPIRSSRMA